VNVIRARAVIPRGRYRRRMAAGERAKVRHEAGRRCVSLCTLAPCHVALPSSCRLYGERRHGQRRHTRQRHAQYAPFVTPPPLNSALPINDATAAAAAAAVCPLFRAAVVRTGSRNGASVQRAAPRHAARHYVFAALRFSPDARRLSRRCCMPPHSTPVCFFTSRRMPPRRRLR